MALLIALMVGADGGFVVTGAADGGTVTDAGRVAMDAGPMRESGVSDAGRRDAGPVNTTAGDAGTNNFWKHNGGEVLNEEGVTDLVEIELGTFQKVSFPQAVTLTVCDNPNLVNISPTGEWLMFTALQLGETRCGFWFSRKQVVPQRFMSVKVTRRDAPDAGARPWWAPERNWQRVKEMKTPGE